MMTNQTPALLQKDITDQVTKKVLVMKQQDGLALPASYSPANALKSAFFTLQGVTTSYKDGSQPALEVCDKSTIANALLDMVIQGLSPAKNQCYFIVYKNTKKNTFELQLQRSYFGTQAILKRLSSVKDIWANVIYEGDKYVIGIHKGREVLESHETKFENRDNKIVGAYAIIETYEGQQILTTMTKKEIDASWSHAKTDKVQKEFPQEMAKRTVINRAAKAFVNTSDDSDLLIESINNTTANEYHDETERKEAEIIDEIDKNANTEILNPEPPRQRRKTELQTTEPDFDNAPDFGPEPDRVYGEDTGEDDPY